MNKVVKYFSFQLFTLLASISSAWSETHDVKYSIRQDLISPAVGISQSSNYTLFSNSSPLLGITPELPEGISSITGLLKVFPSISAPQIDFSHSSPLFIRENQSIGQLVGQFSFNSRIPAYSFAFTEGNGDQHNSLFSIDTNGTLRSAAVFDFEEDEPFFSIRVRVSGGEEQSVVEKVFAIQLVNQIEDIDSDGIEDHLDNDADGDGVSNQEEVALGTNPFDPNSVIDSTVITSRDYKPIVYTNSQFSVEDDSLLVRGDLLDTGVNEVKIIRGIILSQNPDPRLETENHSISQENGSTGEFAATFNIANLSGKSLYYRAFAKNIEGVSYGSTVRVPTERESQSYSWADASQVPDSPGWWNSPWLGTFYAPNQNGWILHRDLNWIFVLPQPENKGIWLWREEIGWNWTKITVFPYLFSHSSQSWIFLHGSSENGALLFDYQKSNWLILKKS